MNATMRFQDAFYCRQKIGALQYSRTPQGLLSVARMVQVKSAYWQKLLASSKPVPKKLILSDWTAYSWDSDKRREVQAKLAELIKEGFTLYLWQDGEVRLLTDLALLEQIDIRRNITPAFQDELIEAAARQGLRNKATPPFIL